MNETEKFNKKRKEEMNKWKFIIYPWDEKSQCYENVNSPEPI